MTVADVATTYGQTRDLVEQEPPWPYLFVQHTLRPRQGTPWRSHATDQRSFVVIAGRARLDTAGTADTRGPLDGWHVPPGAVYRITNAGDEPLVVLEAGTADGETSERPGPGPGTGARVTPLADYTVRKPWGHEVWYTSNLDGVRYAVKQIHMTAGHQSSLQSHQYKAETNYVVDGEAIVLNGLLAPEDPATVIDPATLPRVWRGPRTGWTSAPRVLHRVIARTDYTSIEVSTPELDDVIRWQDDTGRGSGRIDAEHRAVGR
jgi:quercetin dioxygenase-like cupin family protein